MHWAADDQAHGLADGMPESLRSLISRRLAAVPDEQRQILETASTGAVTLIQPGVRITNRDLSPISLARKLARTAGPITCVPSAVQEICRWLAEQFDGFDRATNIENGPALLLELEFLRQLAACMRAGRLSGEHDSMASGRIDVVRRVEQHLFDNLAVPQTVDNLCRIADTSRRTLEYSFKDYFGTSPKRFIKALKLNAARDDLLAGSYGSEQVVEIASGLGFTHMGQFSTDYRHMFGEKPSETLRRNSSHIGA